MNYGMFFGIKCVVSEERNSTFLQQHQATTADELFVFRGNYIQGVTWSR